MKLVRRTGPPSDFTLPLALTDIPGMTFTGDFDDGEVLVLASIRGDNNDAVDFFYLFRVMLDGAAINSQLFASACGIGIENSGTIMQLISISQGRHTITIQGSNHGAAQHFVLANMCNLILIQFPNWLVTPDLT